MIDEDLRKLRTILAAMQPDETISIGIFRCHAEELLFVVDDALVRRAVRKAEAA